MLRNHQLCWSFPSVYIWSFYGHLCSVWRIKTCLRMFYLHDWRTWRGLILAYMDLQVFHVIVLCRHFCFILGVRLCTLQQNLVLHPVHRHWPQRQTKDGLPLGNSNLQRFLKSTVSDNPKIRAGCNKWRQRRVGFSAGSPKAEGPSLSAQFAKKNIIYFIIFQEIMSQVPNLQDLNNQVPVRG